MASNNDTTYSNWSLDIPRSEYYTNLMTVADNIQKYYIWVICIIGFPGNTATLVTITRIKPVTSLTCYVALLAMVDNLTLVVKFTHLILQDFNLKTMTSVECKVLTFAGNILVNYSTWILVVISIERFAAVWFLLKIGLNWARKKSFVVMATVLLTLTGFYLHLLWTITSYFGHCEISEIYHNYFMLNIWYWISASLYAFIPCCLVFLFNILNIVGIRKSADEHRHLTSSTRATTNRDITIMLLVISIMFLVMSTPICIFLLVGQTWLPRIYSDEFATKTVMRQLAFVFCDSNHAINFFLYFLSAKRFRQQCFRCETASSSETVLLRNISYLYTNKNNSPVTNGYEDYDSLTQIRLYTKN